MSKSTREAKAARPPRFGILRVMGPGLLLYLLLTLFFGFFFAFSDRIHDVIGRDAVQLGTGPGALPNPEDPLDASGFLDASRHSLLDVALVAVVLGMGAAFLYHWPLILYFRRLRKGLPVPATIKAAARKRVFGSAAVSACLAPAVMAVMLLARMVGGGGPGRELAYMLPIEAAVLALSSLFIYLWQKHRVQSIYLPWLFTGEELSSRMPGGRPVRIKATLVMVVALSFILPTVVTALFLGTGISFVGSLGSLTPDQISLLFPDLGAMKEIGTHSADLASLVLPIIVPLDVIRTVAGLGFGLLIIGVYVFFIARWTACDILVPLEALRANMARAQAGDLGAFTPAVTSNELGELALGFNGMLRGLAEREKIKELFGQYLTKEVSEAIIDGRVNLNGARYEATVMFTDIRGFTAMSESMSPEEILTFLNDYLGRMIEVIARRGGMIDKFLGDGILAVFGLPVPDPGHAASALAAAEDMRAELATMNAARAASGLAPVRIGIGLHTGDVVAGNVGSALKLQYTVIGDAVNLASRIEGLNKELGSTLLISEATRSSAKASAMASAKAGDLALGGGAATDSGSSTLADMVINRMERLDGVEIRGKRERVTLYRLKE